MSQVLRKTNYLFRRELWENRGGVLWTPAAIAVGAIALISISLALGLDDFSRHLDQMIEWTGGQRVEGDEETRRIDFSRGEIVTAEEDLEWVLWGSQLMGVVQPTLHSIASGFGFVAFLVAFFYLLGGLYNDRKDRTILFWKSLPFSETHGILVKLAVAMFIIPMVALIASVVVQLFFAGAATYLVTQTTDFGLGAVLSEISITTVFFAHFVLLLSIFIKSLPFFSWLLFCSAFSKRSPFLTAILPPIVIASLERLIFGSNYFVEFLASLVGGNSFDFDREYADWLILLGVAMITPLQLLKILLISVPLIGGAIWLRNNRFEI